MKRHRLFALLVSLLSAGWLFPLWLAVDTYLDFWRSVGLPLALGMRPGSSFPFLEFATQCFGIAMIWLALVVVLWSYIGFTAFSQRRAA